MDDIMLLMNQIVIDCMSLNTSQFGIFKEEDRDSLVKLYTTTAGGNATKFISMLSPDQQQCVALWACGRTGYLIDDLADGLEKFVKFLRKSRAKIYPQMSTVIRSDKKIKKKRLF